MGKFILMNVKWSEIITARILGYVDELHAMHWLVG